MFRHYNNPLGSIDNLNSIDNLGYPTKLINIGSGENAARNTIDEMIKIIKESSNNPYVRNTAEHIVYQCSPRDTMAEAAAIYYFVRDHLRYVGDNINLEYLQTPPMLLTKIKTGDAPSGDCDDHTMLVASLLRSIGIPARIRITSYIPNGEWTHVFPQTFVSRRNTGLGINNHNYESKQWITVDSIHNDKPFGWDTSSKASRIKDFTIN